MYSRFRLCNMLLIDTCCISKRNIRQEVLYELSFRLWVAVYAQRNKNSHKITKVHALMTIFYLPLFHSAVNVHTNCHFDWVEA